MLQLNRQHCLASLRDRIRLPSHPSRTATPRVHPDHQYQHIHQGPYTCTAFCAAAPTTTVTQHRVVDRHPGLRRRCLHTAAANTRIKVIPCGLSAPEDPHQTSSAPRGLAQAQAHQQWQRARSDIDLDTLQG